MALVRGSKAWNNVMTTLPIESIDYDCSYNRHQRAPLAPMAAYHDLLCTVTQKWWRMACPAPMQLRDDSPLSYTVSALRFFHSRAFTLVTPTRSKAIPISR